MRVFRMFVFAALCAALAPASAFALCITPAEEGLWKNEDPATSGITKADVFLATCGDVRTCNAQTGVCTTAPTTFRVRLQAKCSPSDCDWGTKTGAKRDAEGFIRTTYDHGFAKRHVYIRAYPEFPGFLRVYVWTDFTAADGRTDYAFDGWFLRR